MNVEGGQFLDDYNQTVYDDIAPTITTRIIESCHYFIYEDDTEYNKGRCLSGDNVTLSQRGIEQSDRGGEK